MIGAGNNLAVEAGYRILEQGGNAIDAGVAGTLAAAVTEPDYFGLRPLNWNSTGISGYIFIAEGVSLPLGHSQSIFD